MIAAVVAVGAVILAAGLAARHYIAALYTVVRVRRTIYDTAAPCDCVHCRAVSHDR